MPPSAAPPLRGLFGDKANRQAAFKYWIEDTARGSLNVALHHCLRALPSDLCSGFGASQARFCPHRYPEEDARARAVWKRLRPEGGTQAEVDAAMRRLWRNVTRTMAEYSVMHRLGREGRVSVEGLEHVNAVRAAGRPLVLAGLHLANWELIGASVNAAGHSIAATYEPPENRFEHDIVNRVRACYGVRTIYPDHAGGRAAYRCVAREKQIFLFYVDEIFRGRVSAPAFGRGPKTKGNIGNVVRLARLTDAEIIVAYCTRIGDAARFKITFMPPLVQMRTSNERADLATNVDAIDQVIAPIVNDHLDQWYYALAFDFAPNAT